MSNIFKKLIITTILASIIIVSLFSLMAMMQGPDGRMVGDCPLSTIGNTLCPQDAVSVALHHLYAYRSFFSIPIGSNLTVLIIYILFTICAIVASILYYSPPRDSPVNDHVSLSYRLQGRYGRKINRWLSLFENSPSKA